MYMTWDGLFGNTYANDETNLFIQTIFVASFGGIFGLCLGGSVISLVEMVYYFTMRLYNRLQSQDSHPTTRPVTTLLKQPSIVSRTNVLPKLRHVPPMLGAGKMTSTSKLQLFDVHRNENGSSQAELGREKSMFSRVDERPAAVRQFLT